MGPFIGFLVLVAWILSMFIDEIFERIQAPGPCLHGRDWGERREVYLPGENWEVAINNETGDIDVHPLREEHIRGASCPCEPRVDLEGSRLVIVHNSYDGREIVEEAVRIMNGVDND